jgi:SAM-dependent methyltransferase
LGFIQNLYDSNKYVRAFAQKLGFTRPINVDILSSRIIEYPWVLSNFPFSTTSKVLDVGSSGSQLPIMFVGLGQIVWTIDVRKFEYKGVITNLTSIQCDARKTDFEDDFFDVVTAVSTIEHIGLGRYGDTKDNKGDKKTLEEILRITKPNGILLMSVPFGIQCNTHSYRVYDNERLYSLLQGFKVMKVDYFVATDKLWIKTTEDQVTHKDCSKKERATVCVKAIKFPK